MLEYERTHKVDLSEFCHVAGRIQLDEVYNSTNHNNKAGFYAFNTFINSPDDECLL
ncbi:hypothetical protein KXV18_007470 [Aspergillus fumigatus]|nr:hypothetical protein KXV18_007470 [Aspergillus fumigatus]